MDLRADFHIEWQSFFFLFATNFDTSSNEMKEWKLKNQNYLFFPRWKKKSGVDVGITRWRTSGFGLLERWRNQWVHFASSPKILFGAAKETDWVQPWFSVWFLFFCLSCLSCLFVLFVVVALAWNATGVSGASSCAQLITFWLAPSCCSRCRIRYGGNSNRVRGAGVSLLRVS